MKVDPIDQHSKEARDLSNGDSATIFAQDTNDLASQGPMTKRSQLLLLASVKACLASFIGRAAAQDTNVTCEFNIGQSKPGAAFAFFPWFEQGQCIRATGSFANCRTRLIGILQNVDEVHQTEYSASATVLTLLPTIGALFGSPTSEIWALLKIFPPAGVLAMFLSFGGSVFPTSAQDYLNVFKKQNIQSFTTEDEARVVKQQQDNHGPSQIADPLHAKLSGMLDGTRGHRLAKCSSLLLVGLGTLALFVLWAANMAGMAVVEQGAVYVNWCTSKWWLHLWYSIVTMVTMFDAWIQLPFNERWTIYITEREDLIGQDLLPGPDDSQTLLTSGSHISTSKHASPNVKSTAASRSRHKTGLSTSSTNSSYSKARTMLAVISVTSEDKHVAFWITGLRLFSRAVGVIIFVFATSVFAQVSLLALPMAQMILVLIMAGGLFGRAVASGIVSIIGERTPILHIMTESNEEADRLLGRLIQYKSAATGSNVKPIMLEVIGSVDGKGIVEVYVEGNRIGQRGPWYRRYSGLFARSFSAVRASDTIEMT